MKIRKIYRVSAAAVGALALGSFAIGAFAIGVLAVGRLAIRRLAVGKGSLASLHVRNFSVDQLNVGDVEVAGSLKLRQEWIISSQVFPSQRAELRNQAPLNDLRNQIGFIHVCWCKKDSPTSARPRHRA